MDETQQVDLILKSYLFPPISYCTLLKNIDIVGIDAHENYQKRSYRNKYDVLGANGKLTLSIPLRHGKNNNQNIKDVLIAYDEDWQKKHIETIKSCYGKSAYFEDYFGHYERLFTKKYDFLFDLNMEALNFITKAFKLNTTIQEGNKYVAENMIQSTIQKGYPQVFEDKYGFVPNLSSLDLLFNMGPESIIYL